jgi:hypothetical protein
MVRQENQSRGWSLEKDSLWLLLALKGGSQDLKEGKD